MMPSRQKEQSINLQKKGISLIGPHIKAKGNIPIQAIMPK